MHRVKHERERKYVKIPVVLTEGVKTKLISYFSSIHGIWQFLPVCKYKQHGFPQFILGIQQAKILCTREFPTKPRHGATKMCYLLTISNVNKQFMLFYKKNKGQMSLISMKRFNQKTTYTNRITKAMLVTKTMIQFHSIRQLFFYRENFLLCFMSVSNRIVM